MKLQFRIPKCNIIACEDIVSSSDNKLYLSNPFTATSKKSIRKFFTYSIIQDIPNGILSFKIQIVSPRGELIKETEDNLVIVEDNIVIVKTKWININCTESGQHTLMVLIKANNDYDVVGCSHICIS